jgi:hypothetical protein
MVGNCMVAVVCLYGLDSKSVLILVWMAADEDGGLLRLGKKEEFIYFSMSQPRLLCPAARKAHGILGSQFLLERGIMDAATSSLYHASSDVLRISDYSPYSEGTQL